MHKAVVKAKIPVLVSLVKVEHNKATITETAHTSAKARLTGVAIRIRIPDLNCHQNLVICSLVNLPGKFHANPLGSFCAKLLTNRQTDKQATMKT